MAFLKKSSDALRELQVEVSSEEDWQTLLSKEGLVVVDAYTKWCGPCKAIVNIFRRIKNETGDELLNFATAETDGIDSLEKYRGKSEPTFLFYGDGNLVNVIRGCDGPLITSVISDQLKKEHQILEGNAEREIFVDKVVMDELDESDEKQDEQKGDEVDEEEEELARRLSVKSRVETPKQIAVALIKPDAVQAGLVDQIIEEMKSNGLEIIKKEERLLTKEEAAEFYKQHEGSDHFEQLIEFMSSGPCMTLVVTKRGEDVGENLLPEFRKLIGPLDVNMAKEEAPNSLRAKYGTDSIQNAVHSCDSSESAARELAFFFPDFNAPVVQQVQKKKRLQRTLALIRPNALQKRRDSILKAIEDSGFLIAMQKEVQLERTQVEELYAEHKDKVYFESLVANMTSGPSLALCLAREDAVQVWRDMLGPKLADDVEDVGENSQNEELEKQEGEVPSEPAKEIDEEVPKQSITSLRQKFSDPEDTINPLHGADTEEQVKREMNLFFPVQTTVAVIKPDAYEKPDEREAIISKIKDAGFKISAHKEVMLTKELAAMFYKEHEGKGFYDNLTDYMSSGPTQFLILSREDAVDGFKSLIGPTKPDEAKEINPLSLRAQFGHDEMKNAIHGSSSVSKAKEVIDEFFPDLKWDEEGNLVNEEELVRDESAAGNGDIKPSEEKNGEVQNGDIQKTGEGQDNDVQKDDGANTPDEDTTRTDNKDTPAVEDTIATQEITTEATEEQPTGENEAQNSEQPEEPKVDEQNTDNVQETENKD